MNLKLLLRPLLIKYEGISRVTQGLYWFDEATIVNKLMNKRIGALLSRVAKSLRNYFYKDITTSSLVWNRYIVDTIEF